MYLTVQNMIKQKKADKDISTEEKILQAARIVFTQKGFAATRTRDIAENAGINLALLNYYYRSKEKLFQQVMEEKKIELFGKVGPIVNDEETTLETKINLLVESYLDTLSKNPDLPIFVMSEIQKNPKAFHTKVPFRNLVLKSCLVKQLRERKVTVQPLNIVWNILGLCVFPFISRPVFFESGILNEQSCNALVQERRKMIPVWVMSMLKNK